MKTIKAKCIGHIDKEMAKFFKFNEEYEFSVTDTNEYVSGFFSFTKEGFRKCFYIKG